MPTKFEAELSATMEQIPEMQLELIYNVLGFRQVIAPYDIVTGPWWQNTFYQNGHQVRSV